MRCLPKLLVIWGAVLPLMTYPWAHGYSAQAGLLGSLPHMSVYVLESEVPYAIVVAFGLWVVGLGLTANAVVEDGLRERLLRAVERLAEMRK